MATVGRRWPRSKPFRALRYDGPTPGRSSAGGASVRRASPPGSGERTSPRSPYNVVHLTLPDSEDGAARDLAAWQRGGRPRARRGAVRLGARAGLRRPGRRRAHAATGSSPRCALEPYERGVVLPHERTHAGPKEGRLRLLRRCASQLEPIFLLYDGDAASSGPAARRTWRSDGDRLWRLDGRRRDRRARSPTRSS